MSRASRILVAEKESILASITNGAKPFLKLGKLERYAHALAGAMIIFSGLSVQFLGL